MKRSIIIAAAVVVSQLTASACAPGYRDGRTIAGRQEYQRERIREGADEGDLTRREAQQLRERSRNIAEDRREARENGYVDPRERRKLRHEQNRLSDDIYRQRHDDDER